MHKPKPLPVSLSDNHWRVPFYKQRMTAKDWKTLLLEGYDVIIYQGHLIKMKVDILGFGIIDVYKDPKSMKDAGLM